MTTVEPENYSLGYPFIGPQQSGAFGSVLQTLRERTTVRVWSAKMPEQCLRRGWPLSRSIRALGAVDSRLVVESRGGRWLSLYEMPKPAASLLVGEFGSRQLDGVIDLVDLRATLHELEQFWKPGRARTEMEIVARGMYPDAISLERSLIYLASAPFLSSFRRLLAFGDRHGSLLMAEISGFPAHIGTLSDLLWRDEELRSFTSIRPRVRKDCSDTPGREIDKTKRVTLGIRFDQSVPGQLPPFFRALQEPLRAVGEWILLGTDMAPDADDSPPPALIEVYIRDPKSAHFSAIIEAFESTARRLKESGGVYAGMRAEVFITPAGVARGRDDLRIVSVI